MSKSTDKVVKNIKNAYEVKRIKLIALATEYAGRAINIFRQKQSADGVWTNRTSQALKKMFAKPFVDKQEIGFFLSHGVEYGIYLEVANDRRFEVIRPIMLDLAPKFIADARKII